MWDIYAKGTFSTFCPSPEFILSTLIPNREGSRITTKSVSICLYVSFNSIRIHQPTLMKVSINFIPLRDSLKSCFITLPSAEKCEILK